MKIRYSCSCCSVTEKTDVMVLAYATLSWRTGLLLEKFQNFPISFAFYLVQCFSLMMASGWTPSLSKRKWCKLSRIKPKSVSRGMPEEDRHYISIYTLPILLTFDFANIQWPGISHLLTSLNLIKNPVNVNPLNHQRCKPSNPSTTQKTLLDAKIPVFQPQTRRGWLSHSSHC